MKGGGEGVVAVSEVERSGEMLYVWELAVIRGNGWSLREKLIWKDLECDLSG